MRNIKLEFHHQLPPFINSPNKKYKIYQKKKNKICQDSRGRAKQLHLAQLNLSLVVNEKKKTLASSKLGIRETRGTYNKNFNCQAYFLNT